MPLKKTTAYKLDSTGAASPAAIIIGTMPLRKGGAARKVMVFSAERWRQQQQGVIRGMLPKTSFVRICTVPVREAEAGA